MFVPILWAGGSTNLVRGGGGDYWKHWVRSPPSSSLSCIVLWRLLLPGPYTTKMYKYFHHNVRHLSFAPPKNMEMVFFAHAIWCGFLVPLCCTFTFTQNSRCKALHIVQYLYSICILYSTVYSLFITVQEFVHPYYFLPSYALSLSLQLHRSLHYALHVILHATY